MVQAVFTEQDEVRTLDSFRKGRITFEEKSSKR